MNVVLISIVIFLLTLAASYAGLEVQKRLREEHKTGESKGVVGQMAGLLTLLLALVLGTLIGVSYAYFSTQKTELEGFSAQVLRLDQALGQYGPETKPLRDKMKAGIVKAYETFWGGGEVDPSLLTVEGAVGQRAGDQRLSGDASTEDGPAKAGFGDGEPVLQHGRAIAALDVAASGERAGVLGPHRDPGVLDGRAVFRHRPVR